MRGEADRLDLTVNGKREAWVFAHGYAVVDREWRSGDVVELSFRMPVREVHGHEAIEATRGQVAFERGPIVYCFEQIDQSLPQEFERYHTKTKFKRGEGLLAGVDVLEVDGFTAIPYFAWNNRGLASMRVWTSQKVRPGSSSEFP